MHSDSEIGDRQRRKRRKRN